ncbi:MAG TPA: hypothetical protein VGL93_24585 [Streptosporangiaceae bacterium]|jgi:hypothetical protein
MSVGRTTVVVYALVTGGIVAIGLVLWDVAPLWAVFLLVPGLIVVAIALLRLSHQRIPRPSPEPTTAYVQHWPVQRREQMIVDVLLPSERPDYSFLFSATVVWTPARDSVDDSAVNMGALAVSAILGRACEITKRCDPTHVSLVEHQLASALGGRQPDQTGRLQAVAEAVRLKLPDDDRQRLDKLATVRKDKEVWEHERIYEQNKRDYLGRDVLKDPGSAVIWWLSRNENAVQKTVEDIGLLTELSSVANNGVVPEQFRHYMQDGQIPAQQPYIPMFNGTAPETPAGPNGNATAADHFGAFLRATRFDAADPEQQLFARRVAELLTMHDRHGVAAELIDRFDPDEQDGLDEES